MSDEKAFELIGSLGLSVDQAQKALLQLGGDIRKFADNAEKEGDRAGNSFEKAFTRAGQRVGKTVAVMLGDVGGAVTALTNITSGALGAIPVIGGGLRAAFDEAQGAIRGAVEQGFAFDDMMTRSRAAYTLLTGDIHSAQVELDTLTKIASSSGFGRDAIFDAAQQLQLMGLNAERVPSAIAGIATAARALGGDASTIATIADSFARIIELDKVSSRDARRLVSAGVPIYDLFAESLGQSKARVKRLMDAGVIDAKDFVTLITAQLNSQKFKDAAQQASQTIEVQTEMLNRKRTALFGAALQTAYGQTEGALANANHALGGPAAQGMAASVNNATKQFTDLITATINKLSSGDLLGGVVQAGNSIAEGLKTGIEQKAGEAVESMTSLASKMLGSVKDLLDIHSPSGVTAREIGAPISQGIAQGFADDFDNNTKPLILDRIEELLNDPRVRAFLEVIKKSEVGNDRSPYTRAFGPLGHVDPSTINVFDRSTWPGMQTWSPSQHKMVWTHPYGAYQAEPGTYQRFANATGVRDLSAHSQDLFAVWDLMQHSSALRSVLAGDAGGAMSKLGKEWESFAVNGPKKTESLLALFDRLTTAGLPAFTQAVQQATAALQNVSSAPQSGQPSTSIIDGGATAVADVVAEMDELTTSTKIVKDESALSLHAVQDIPAATEQIDTATDAIRRKYTGLRGDLLEMGFTSKNMASIFEESFTGAFTQIDQGFKGMLLSFVSSFLKALDEMATAAIAKKLAEKIFGAAAGGTGGGWLGALFGFLGIAAGAATGGGGGGRISGKSVIGGIGHHYMGGKNVTGLSWVGERGPELVNFGNSGADIYSNGDSKRMLGGIQTGDVHIHIHAPQGANPQQLTLPARAAAREFFDHLQALAGA